MMGPSVSGSAWRVVGKPQCSAIFPVHVVEKLDWSRTVPQMVTCVWTLDSQELLRMEQSGELLRHVLRQESPCHGVKFSPKSSVSWIAASKNDKCHIVVLSVFCHGWRSGERCSSAALELVAKVSKVSDVTRRTPAVNEPDHAPPIYISAMSMS